MLRLVPVSVSGSVIRIDCPALTTPAPVQSEWVDDGSLTGGLTPLRFYRIGVR